MRRSEIIRENLQINHQLQQLSYSGDIKEQSADILERMLYFQWLDFFHPSQMKLFQAKDDDDDDIKSSTLLGEMRNLLNETSAR